MELSLGQIAEETDGRVIGNAAYLISGVAPFDAAEPGHITFVDSKKYIKRIDQTAAGAVFVPRDLSTDVKNLIQVDHPKVAFAKTMQLFHRPILPRAGIHESAVVGAEFKHGIAPAIGSFVNIGQNVTIGDRVVIETGVVLGDGVVVGDDTRIYPNVTILSHCQIGNRVIIHAGTVIGSDGYGYVSDGNQHYKIPQIGIVQIDDDVEIGAANTIDRATFGKTWIRSGVKTDNLVHIAHNVTIGKHTLLIAQAVIAGSTSIGNHCIVAGGARVGDHLKIGDHVVIGPMAGVVKSIPDGQVVVGAPQMPKTEFFRIVHALPELPSMKKRLKVLEKRIEQLEDKERA